MDLNRMYNGTMNGLDIYKNKELTSDSSDHEILDGVGFTFVISDVVLGCGSYGQVFLATDENGKEVAVKCCKLGKKGIPNILESSIMSTIIHPHINRAHRILASDSKLYIFQDLASTDLSFYTKKNKSRYRPTDDELKNWCFSIAQGVSALHANNIIHADIKASNVLLFPDNTVKLTDFTLSTKKWKKDEMFEHNVCTCTHRPLECLKVEPWDESLDIWSLGCTFYEIAYQDSLFPYQGVLDPNIKDKNKESKIKLRQRSINAILDWGKRGPTNSVSYVSKYQEEPIDYLPYKLHPDFNSPNMKLFNDLLCKMLRVDPRARPTIKEVIEHPFFNNLGTSSYMSIQRPLNKMSVQEQARAHRYIQIHTNNEIVQTLALDLYCRCNTVDHINEVIKSAACTWIASKIVLGYPIKIPTLPPHQILSAERDICHDLKFRLHTL